MLVYPKLYFMLSIVIFSITVIEAADWPQWLGPERNGISTETDLLKNWPETGPKILWRTPLGHGFSAISILNQRAYTMYADHNGEFVVCLDVSNGKEIWRFRTGSYYQERQGGDGPRSTPTVEANQLYVLGAEGTLFSLNTANGTKLWEKNLATAFDSVTPKWGFSTSPLIVDNLLLVESGGTDGSVLVDMIIDRETNATAIALEKTTGHTVWTALNDKMAYSSPIAFTTASVRQAIFFNAYALVSLAPATGKIYWRYPWKTSWDVSAATPIHIPPDKIFISAGNKSAIVQTSLQKDGVEVATVWKNSVMKNHFSTSIYYQGFLYGFDNSILKCIDAKTGLEQWKTRGYGKGSLIIADGHLIILGEQGNLGLAEAAPNSFRLIANVPIMHSRCWTIPSLADGKLFLRDEKEVVCLNLRED